MDYLSATTGLLKLEISRNAKGEHSYSLTTYCSMKGRAPEAGIARADGLRLDIERRLGLLYEGPDAEPVDPEEIAKFAREIVSEAGPTVALASVYNRLMELGRDDLATSIKDALTTTPEKTEPEAKPPRKRGTKPKA